MSHPALIALLLLASLKAHAEPAKKWTRGRSVCDPAARQLVDGGVANPVEHKSLSQAWDYAQADAEVLANLQCFPQAAASAAVFAANLRAVQAGVMPGLEATSCGAGSAPERLARVRDSLSRMHAYEEFFASALDKYDSVGVEISSANPAGLAFDDCRSKAARSWASVRLSLNKLSCELSGALNRLDSFRERAEVGGLACAAPFPLVVAQSQIAAEPERAPASQYPAFSGVLVSPVAASAEETK
jgi:hypothetical protein